MTFLKRAWLSIVRKPIKTLIIFVIILIVSTILVSITSIERAAKKQKSEFLDSGQLGFTLRNNPISQSFDQRIADSIPSSLINDIKNIEGVNKVNRKSSRVANIIGIKSAKLKTQNAFDAETLRLFGETIQLFGRDDTSLDMAFKLNSLKLVKGRHLTEDDTRKVMIHEDFAKLNKLDIGSKVKLKAVNDKSENPYGAKDVIELEVVGIFAGKNKQMPSSFLELNENIFYTDNNTVKSLLAYPEDRNVYHDATFFTNNRSDLKNAMAKIKKMNIDWNVYELNESSDYTMGMTESLQNMENIIKSIKIFTIIISIIILSIISFIWINDRKYEIGTLLSIGVSKGQIALQMFIEIAIISILALAISYYSGNAVSQRLGDKLTNVASERATKNIRKGFSSQLAGDIETAALTKTPDKIIIKNDINDMKEVSKYTFAMILVVQGIALTPLLLRKPKELLIE